MKEIKDIWAQIGRDTWAMSVPGGVLIRVSEGQESGNGISLAQSMCFFPCDWAEEWVENKSEDVNR